MPRISSLLLACQPPILHIPFRLMLVVHRLFGPGDHLARVFPRRGGAVLLVIRPNLCQACLHIDAFIPERDGYRGLWCVPSNECVVDHQILQVV